MTEGLGSKPTSNRPNIAYVDESEDERANFENDAYFSELFGQVHVLAPEPNINDLIEKLLSLHIDALISDFNLSEAAPLNYDGEKLVATFLQVRSDFPCFIRTSYDDEALASSDDVNRVYSKNKKSDEGAGRYLFKRILAQIDRYRNRVEDWQVELEKLLAIDVSARTAADIERIVDLDTNIEGAFGRDAAIAKSIKMRLFEPNTLLDSEKQLLEETERLIADMKRTLDE
jgi:hypothetical protein